jgi:hypothetical protein
LASAHATSRCRSRSHRAGSRSARAGDAARTLDGDRAAFVFDLPSDRGETVGSFRNLYRSPDQSPGGEEKAVALQHPDHPFEHRRQPEPHGLRHVGQADALGEEPAVE